MNHRTLEPADARALLQGPEGWTYVDVRTEEEFAAGHAAGAWNVPFAVRDAAGRMAANPEFLGVMERAFPRDAKLVLGCASGVRSENACRLLAAHGWTSLVNLANGYSGARDPMGGGIRPGWQGSGLPCEATASPERSYRIIREGREGRERGRPPA